MKTFKPIKLMLIAATLLITQLACDKDSESGEKVNTEDRGTSIVGKWVAVEYYSNDDGADGKVNLLGKTITSQETSEIPCTTRFDVYEERQEYIELNLLANKTYENRDKGHYKYTEYRSSDCSKPVIEEDGWDDLSTGNWSLKDNNTKLSLGSEKDFGDASIESMTTTELVLKWTHEDEFMRVKFKKK